MNSDNIHCTHIHVHTGTDLGTAERMEKYEQWQYTLYSYTCTYRYVPEDSREGWRRSMNSDNIHCTHIHVHTGTDLRTAERAGGEA